MLGDLALLGEGFVGGLFGGDDFAELGHGDLGGDGAWGAVRRLFGR